MLLSHLVVVAIGSATLFVAVGLVAPAAFDAAMGHAMSGVDGMSEMMSELVRTAFQEAIQGALVIAISAAALAAIIVSIALSSGLSRPIGRLAEASRRIASGRYAERVSVASDDEIGELAESFNTMADSLEATERRRLQLVGDVAHELRTPVATIDGYLEGIEDGIIKPRDTTWLLLRGETARLSLPLVGLSAAAVFLNAYKTPLFLVGIGMNVIGIVVIARQLRRARRTCAIVDGALSGGDDATG